MKKAIITIVVFPLSLFMLVFAWGLFAHHLKKNVYIYAAFYICSVSILRLLT